ncbi:carboxymuconolactone decarboxylase family protein [Actinoplanes sp. NPDC051861]|uniref:carboxymuconolactone decarboxylase family protein n=1 Tax=Actinoplanes sp. NPDC051861 TaxID=3155170 RepID=UPI00342543F1
MTRYIMSDPMETATGATARIFAQSRRELGAPFAPHLAPVPALHAATWTLLRESLLAGEAPRARKEAAALAVSVANRCPFCIDAHGALLHATGAHRLARAVLRGETPPDPDDAAVVTWASASGSGLGPVPAPPSQAAEFAGTVLVSHFINRMVDVLRPGSLLISPLRRLAGAALSRRVRRPVRANDSIGTAYACFSWEAHAGGELLSPPSRRLVSEAVADWNGEHPPPGDPWLPRTVASAPAAEREAVRLALLAAVAPYRLTVAPELRTDERTVRIVAFGAVTAVERIAGETFRAGTP